MMEKSSWRPADLLAVYFVGKIADAGAAHFGAYTTLDDKCSSSFESNRLITPQMPMVWGYLLALLLVCSITSAQNSRSERLPLVPLMHVLCYYTPCGVSDTCRVIVDC